MELEPSSLDGQEQGADLSGSASSLDQPVNASEPISPEPGNRGTPHVRRVIAVIIALLILGGGIFAGIILQKHGAKPHTSVVINTQSLDAGTLNRLTKQAGGATTQQLTITPDTIFKNSLTIQGSTAIQKDLAVSGSLTVTKNAAIGGNAAVAGNLTVSGQISGASLSVGSISISTVNVSSNVTFGGHLIPQGTAPSAVPSVAASGGKVSVTGNDTAGTVTITMGGGALHTGEMAIVTFKTSFGTTPKVQLTPINDVSSELGYYATRSATFFTVNTSNTPKAGATYVFDYLVTQ